MKVLLGPSKPHMQVEHTSFLCGSLQRLCVIHTLMTQCSCWIRVCYSSQHLFLRNTWQHQLRHFFHTSGWVLLSVARIVLLF